MGKILKSGEVPHNKLIFNEVGTQYTHINIRKLTGLLCVY